jgi:hypothetical protein
MADPMPAVFWRRAVDQYARWNFRLCPSVAGLAPGGAEPHRSHCAARAKSMSRQRTGCQPNLVIIFAPIPDDWRRRSSIAAAIRATTPKTR